ncbi:MAG: carbonic anhydrase/acetyltransferase-like protein (isoleucine patch superfamily) [Myxococcota bacterium]|jgi:carbonic anhydrase/acetyltransferase-like protein (isoleucine patch superfamily)
MKNILPYRGLTPIIDPSTWIAPNAFVCGDVTIGKNVGIWFGCSIRGDVAKIHIGDDTNIQDNSIIHVTRANHAQNKTGDAGAPTYIGKGVTIGHGAIIHACTIEDYAFIGMGAIVMDLSKVEKYGMLAAGAVLTPGKVIKSGQIWAGNPAKYFRDLTKIESDYINTSADNYVELMKEYKLPNIEDIFQK